MFMEHGEVEVRRGKGGDTRSWRFFTSEVAKRSSRGLPTEQPRLQIPSCESPNPKL